MEGKGCFWPLEMSNVNLWKTGMKMITHVQMADKEPFYHSNTSKCWTSGMTKYIIMAKMCEQGWFPELQEIKVWASDQDEILTKYLY